MSRNPPATARHDGPRPGPARALTGPRDTEIREAVTGGTARLLAEEEKVTAVARRFAERKRASRAPVRGVPAATRSEERVIRDVSADLRKYAADSSEVGEPLVGAGLTPNTPPATSPG